MGVAGQIFAARVAIGLAIPSPKALSQTGNMLGNFSSKMYKRLNSQHLKAAQERSSQAESELKSANARLANFADKANRDLMKSAQQSINKTNAMFKGQVASSGRQVQGMRTRMAKLAPTVAPKLFAGLTQDMKSAQKYQRILHNFIKLTDKERKVVLEGMKAHVADAKVRAARATLIAKENKERKQWAAAQVEDALNLENTYKQLMQLDKDRFNEKARIAKEERKLQKELQDAHEAHTDALNRQEEQTQALIEAEQRLNEAMHNAVYQIKTGFQEILRESISILTGFYYKLNEVTDSLKTFERELLNANSVFGLTRDELFETSQTIVQFGQQFGLAMDNGAKGLYQLASAGLSAEEAMAVLPHTLKLSMAVQGDHNTISKLTAQTLFGFGMEMDQAGILTDKFAHAIQKSLIEYEDLTSAIKFALPFFTATGQSIDQLLGSLQILTNRALEAGIAGRGLRQALAEFAESAEDNATAFAKMGINILNAEGEMLQLTEIAHLFADAIGPEIASNTELLTALIQDLNVRGATAFIHLVQNAEEFEQAVLNTANAGGELDEMVRIQNESIEAQIQILKNNVEAIFFMRDANADGTESLNEFHQGVLDVIASLRGLIVEELADGTYALTKFGKDVRSLATEAVKMFGEAVKALVKIVQDFTEAGFLNLSMLKAYFMPVAAVLKVVEALGPGIIKVVVWWKVLNAVIPVSTLLTLADEIAIIANTNAKIQNAAATAAQAGAERARSEEVAKSTAETLAQTGMLSKLGNAFKGFGKLLANPYVLATIILVTLAAIIIKLGDFSKAWEGLQIGFREFIRMMKFAVSPLVDLFKEWAQGAENIAGAFGSDHRSSMINFMNELGAVVALVVYGMSELLTLFLKFMTPLGWILNPEIQGDLKTLIDFLNGEITIREAIFDPQGTTQGFLNMNPNTLEGSMKKGTFGQKAMGTLLYGTGEAGKEHFDYGWGSHGKGGGYLGSKYSAGGMIEWGTEALTGFELANGGMIPAYANGGPILVGERGPELFVPPRMGGQVLNTDRTRNLLRGQQGGFGGSGRAIDTLVVSNLVAENSQMKQSKIAVDTYAGVV